LLVVLDSLRVLADEVEPQLLDGHLRGFEEPLIAGVTDTGDVHLGLDCRIEIAVEYPSETRLILRGSNMVTVFC
jgi:hypothetical protein